jgi:hypothetical protein
MIGVPWILVSETLQMIVLLLGHKLMTILPVLMIWES